MYKNHSKIHKYKRPGCCCQYTQNLSDQYSNVNMEESSDTYESKSNLEFEDYKMIPFNYNYYPLYSDDNAEDFSSYSCNHDNYCPFMLQRPYDEFRVPIEQFEENEDSDERYEDFYYEYYPELDYNDYWNMFPFNDTRW